MAAVGLIDLSQIYAQLFSVPKTLIYYVFNNSKIILSQKLMSSCKTFKLLHLKKNETKLNTLFICEWKCEIVAGLFKEKKSNHVQYKIDTAMKTIKILNSFTLLSRNRTDFYLSNLMPKLDLYQTKKIIICVEIELKREHVEKILHPSLMVLELNCYSCKDFNLPLLAFQRCSKLIELQIFVLNQHVSASIINEKIFKEMVLTKRENKIERLALNSMSGIFDIDDFMNLINNHLARYCYIQLSTLSDECFDALENIFRTVKKNNRNVGFCINGRGFRSFSSLK